jgi:hypothetical protein
MAACAPPADADIASWRICLVSESSAIAGSVPTCHLDASDQSTTSRKVVPG